MRKCIKMIEKILEGIRRRVSFYKVKLKGKYLTNGERNDFEFKISELGYIFNTINNNRKYKFNLFGGINRERLLLLVSELSHLI